MNPPDPRLRPLLLLVFLLGCLAFGYPALVLFSVPGTFHGLPVLPFALFAAWLLMILAIAWLSEGQ
ncbi:MAG: hypothetical protein AAF725_03405 [Acidobacteriota bacterium]